MRSLIVLALLLFLQACQSTSDDLTPAQERSEIRLMRHNVLNELTKISPQAKQEIERSAGYAVFSNAQINIIFVAAGTGYGVVKNNITGKETFMEMGEAGLGLGLGAKDFRAVFVFHTEKALNQFVEKGWAFGAEADAAAKSNDKGDQVSYGVTLGNITVYQLTENGIALQATVKGTKYWQSARLN